MTRVEQIRARFLGPVDAELPPRVLSDDDRDDVLWLLAELERLRALRLIVPCSWRA